MKLLHCLFSVIFPPDLEMIYCWSISQMYIIHKLTNLLKSVSPCVTMVHSKESFWLFNLLDHQKMAFPHFEEKLTLLEKTKRKLPFLKKVSKVVNLINFLFVHAVCTAISSSNWKNNNTIFMLARIPIMRKLCNLITTSFAKK